MPKILILWSQKIILSKKLDIKLPLSLTYPLKCERIALFKH